MSSSLDELVFDNSSLRELPLDPDDRNLTRQVWGACLSRVSPSPVSAPYLVAISNEVAQLLGLSFNDLNEERWSQVLSGNRILSQSDPYAACYGGYQFGNWAGQLGDGRAISLGEVINPRGERWELQLKGAGPTPYSRHADGRAVMRSSVREFLCSEAMHHLGVPTTRALSLVGTGDSILRDMFYDGHPKHEPGAVVCRVSPSFLRFGSFELPANREDHEVVRRLADYAVLTHFAHLGAPGPEVYAQWATEIAQNTATMIAHWMRVGFVHGVMNTDNMSILGLTIDYGPYGWLEGYDPNWTPNTTDAIGRRYRFGNQPWIGLWNLTRFVNAIYPLVGVAEPLEAALHHYVNTVQSENTRMTREKLGFQTSQDEDEALIEELKRLLQLVETDMTIFYRTLADVPSSAAATEDELLRPLGQATYAEPTSEQRDQWLTWFRNYAHRLRQEGTSDSDRRQHMNGVNPKYVLRNYLAQVAIDQAEQGDGAKVKELLEVLRHPYDEQPDNELYAAKRPEWARHRPGCSMLSCSS